MKILYLGDSFSGSTAAHRADALRRCGHEVVNLDLAEELAQSITRPLWWKIHYRTGYRLLGRRVFQILEKHLVGDLKFDLAWVSGGEFLNLEALRFLREKCGRVLLYSNDDPTGGRDGRRWDTLLRSLSGYDLCAVVREVNVREFEARGARKVDRVWMSYDEIAHAPFPDPAQIPEIYRSDIAFAGTWIKGENRDDFLAGLIERGLSLSIWGGRWEKSPRWLQIKPHWRGPFLRGRDYVAALQGAKITLGLLSKGNRDEHTTRSLEVPFAGGLLCAERTPEHGELYREGEEAVFWSSQKECADCCEALLFDEERREQIRAKGMRRIRELHAGNEDVCRRILTGLAD